MSVNLGVIGCGTIMPSFLKALASSQSSKINGIASEYSQNSISLAKEFNIPNCFKTYKELAQSSKIDIVYIATTQNLHDENALLFLENGKAVLCEKPITYNSKRAFELISFAREKKLFLMEGMWTRFLPAIVQVKKWLDAGLIGRINHVYADFGFTNDWGPERRLLNRNLCGGSLMDNGVYPISFASLVYGRQPDEIKTTSYIGPTGVDEISSYLFKYGEDQFAMLSSSIRLHTFQNATIIGETGIIFLPEFWRCQKVIVYKNGEAPVTYSFPFLINGFEYEIEAVNSCLRNGKLECERMPLDESLAIIQTTDKIRQEWGLEFPFEHN